jgi:SAM-dependent methyltransferase
MDRPDDGTEGVSVDKERKMEEVRANFASGSTGYDDRIKKIIPRYDEMLDALVSCVRPPRDRRLRIIDIGCGTGAVSARLLHSHPDIELTCLDMTAEMLDIAKERLKGRDVRFVLADIYEQGIEVVAEMAYSCQIDPREPLRLEALQRLLQRFIAKCYARHSQPVGHHHVLSSVRCST